MKRKIIRQGKSTLTVSLPSKFVKKYGIEGGTEIEIEEREGELLLNPQKKSHGLSIEIDITDFTMSLFWRCINALYVKGADEIIIHYQGNEQLRWIHKTQNELIGFAVTKETEHTCILKEVSVTKELEFDNMLRQLFFILKTMSRDTLQGLSENSTELLTSINYREEDLNKNVRYCLRILNKTGYKDFRKTMPIYNIIILLENLGDSLRCIAKEINPKTKLEKVYFEIFQDIDQEIEEFYFLFFKKDIELTKKLYKKNKQIWAKAKEIKTRTREETLLIGELRKIIDIFSELVECEFTLII